MRPHKKLLFGFAVFLSTAVVAANSPAAENPPPADDGLYSRFGLDHTEGGGIGDDTGYTTFKGFFAPKKNQTMPFVDVRGHIFDDGTFATNLGAGLRRLRGDRIYGVNAFYDYRNTSLQGYHQLSLGLEDLGAFWDARVNGYLPVGKRVSDPFNAQFGRFSGNSLYVVQQNEFAMRGGDAEIGFHLGEGGSLKFYGAAGPYFYGNPVGSDAVGGKVRFKATYDDYLSLEIVEHYDNIFHNGFQGIVSFSIPLERPTAARGKEPALAGQMVQPVERQEIIPAKTADSSALAVDPATGAPYSFIFVDNTSSSAGTYESPYHSLTQAQNNSQANDIIYVFPGDGTTANMDHGITLKDGQKLWGSGVSHPLSTPGGDIAIPQMTATAPQITNSDPSGRGVTLARDNEISGMTITQTSDEAIYGADPGTFTLSYSTITQDGHGSNNPVYLAASSPLTATFDHNTFADNGNGAVFIDLKPGSSGSRISFTNNTATNNAQVAGNIGVLNIDPDGAVGSATVIVSNNTATGNTGSAVIIQDTLGGGVGSFTSFTGTFADNTFTNNVGAAIDFASDADTVSLSLTNNNLSDNEGGGLAVSANTSSISDLTVVLDNNRINGSSGSGVSGVTFAGVSRQFTLTATNNTINNNDSSAILWYSNTATAALDFTISNNTIEGNMNNASNAGGGVSIDGFKSLNLVMDSNTLSNNAGGSAVGLFGGSVPTPTGDMNIVFTNNTLTSGDTFDAEYWGPASACLNIHGNTSTTPTAYNAANQGSGTFNITPGNYAAANTGGFNLTGVTTGSCP